MSSKKVDNRSLTSKIALRLWLLKRMGLLSDVSVLDTCTGAGMIWSAMEQHCTITRWIRCDLKPRPGKGIVLKLSATQSLTSMSLDEFNVVDIDTYGEPWEAYRALLQNFTRPTAVFLTHGRIALGSIANSTKVALGMPVDWPIPGGPMVTDYLSKRCLEDTWNFATIKYAAMNYSPSGGGRAAVSYYALGLEPK